MSEGRQAQRIQFARLWREHEASLGRVVRSYARPGADQADLAQNVALAIWKALPSFRGQASEKTFVLRIAHNQALRHALIRRADVEISIDIVDLKPGPDQEVADRQEVERLFQHVRRMPLTQREVLGLALENLSHAEIGEALGISVGNVAVRISRARATLRALMQEDSHE